MNKIFRVVWNHSTQTWGAVSELAKGKVKSSVSNTCESKILFKKSSLNIAIAIGLSVFATNTLAAIAEGTINGTNSSDVLNYNTPNNRAGVGASGNNYSAAVTTIPIGTGSKANQGG